MWIEFVCSLDWCLLIPLHWRRKSMDIACLTFSYYISKKLSFFLLWTRKHHQYYLLLTLLYSELYYIKYTYVCMYACSSVSTVRLYNTKLVTMQWAVWGAQKPSFSRWFSFEWKESRGKKLMENIFPVEVEKRSSGLFFLVVDDG